MVSYRSKGKSGAEAEGGTEPQLVHGSAVALAGRGVLILGASGSGKSALALRLVGRGAALVADDRVWVERRGGALVARAAETTAGLIEARGFGLLRVASVPEAPLLLAVDLDRAPAARMPQPVTFACLGLELELISGCQVPDIDLVLTICVQNGRAFPE
jgi:HPr kinase/phosphorylase